MSDALNELRALRERIAADVAESRAVPVERRTFIAFASIENGERWIKHIDARIAELEAQQAEPSDAEIEAWRREAIAMPLSLVANSSIKIDDQCFYIHKAELDEAVALMRRGRGDQRLRELADACTVGSWHEYQGDMVNVRVRRVNWDALRAALGEQ